MTRNKLIILFSFLLLLSASMVYAGSTAFGDKTHTVNSTVNYYGESQIGDTYEYTINYLSYTDASQNDTGCFEQFALSYSNDGSSWTNTSFSNPGTTATNSTGTTGIITYGLTGIKYIRLYGNATINSIDSVTTTTCSLTGASVSYDGAFSDTLEGLPSMGSQIGLFLSNLAPGVGVMLLIIAIFAGIAGIVASVVIVVQRKFSE